MQCFVSLKFVPLFKKKFLHKNYEKKAYVFIVTSGNIDAIGIRNSPIQKTGEVKTIVSIPVKIAPTGSTGHTLLIE